MPKLKLLKSYYSSLYGCELWHLFRAAISDVRIAWRKGLRIESGRRLNTHIALFAPSSDSIPLMKKYVDVLY